MEKRTVSPDKALSKLMAYCSREERSEYDVRKKMKDWGVVATEANRIVEQLKEDGFLSASRYVTAYIRGKYLYNKWGRTKISFGLQQKGFKQNEIDDALEDFFSNVDYKEMILNELQKKKKTLKVSESYEQKTKLLQFAQSRGYELNLALSCIETLLK